jgi:hypothetical protein
MLQSCVQRKCCVSSIPGILERQANLGHNVPGLLGNAQRHYPRSRAHLRVVLILCANVS